MLHNSFFRAVSLFYENIMKNVEYNICDEVYREENKK